MINPPIELQNAVQNLLKDLDPGDLVLVGCSGGADSLALVWTTSVVGKRLELKTGAVIVDHQLISESNDVAQNAKKQCEELGIEKVIIKKVEVNQTNEGLEAAARIARYEAFENVLHETNAKVILLAHTQDDQAETVLMRLTRGSGAKSLSGMSAISGKYLRPFLHLRKKIVHDSLDLIGMKAWQDPANFDNQYLRVKVRQELMPKLIEVLGEGAISSLDKTSQLLRLDNQALDELAQKFVDAQDDVKKNGLKVKELENLPEAIRTRVLKICAVASGVHPGPFSFEHIEAIDALVKNWHGQGNVDLPGFIQATRVDGSLRFISSKH
ncbi:MAG: tRNA lysidine(34) synthetase TilS [Actinobacteria bacterium]|nr:tRNA lysidine(34) synthetase TilS [Actinomycetota bacterium]